MATPSIGPIPWVWTRRQIAERWHCTPMYVDWVAEQAPAEIVLELQLQRIEAEERPPRA